MDFLRRPVKDTASNNVRRWRQKFHEEYKQGRRAARESRQNQFREDQIIKEEWKMFLERNQDALKREGFSDINMLIEDSLYELNEAQVEKLEADQYQMEEQAEIENAIKSYEEARNQVICVNCRRAILIPAIVNHKSVNSCPACGFYTTESCLHQILQAANAHADHCTGSIGYGLEAGSDDTILAACNQCDLWDLFSL